MSLKLKSEENLALVKQCMDADTHRSAVAGRAYYAAFQRIKHALESNGFDYDAFLRRINATNERHYSHGTLQVAARDFLQARGVSSEDLRVLMNVNSLYYLRRKADYFDDIINVGDLRRGYRSAARILALLQKVGY